MHEKNVVYFCMSHGSHYSYTCGLVFNKEDQVCFVLQYNTIQYNTEVLVLDLRYCCGKRAISDQYQNICPRKVQTMLLWAFKIG